jgi:hypothetical protein
MSTDASLAPLQCDQLGASKQTRLGFVLQALSRPEHDDPVGQVIPEFE